MKIKVSEEMNKCNYCNEYHHESSLCDEYIKSLEVSEEMKPRGFKRVLPSLLIKCCKCNAETFVSSETGSCPECGSHELDFTQLEIVLREYAELKKDAQEIINLITMAPRGTFHQVEFYDIDDDPNCYEYCYACKLNQALSKWNEKYKGDTK